ncbi:MAG: acetyl-CoA C-acyltransferase, partial [Achromobacter sp.]
MTEVIVAAAVRTAIGDFGGSLKDVPPSDLGATVIREAVARAGVGADEVGHVAVGHVINTEPRDMYLSRVATLGAGLAKETPAFNVNRLCGSGLQAIISASQSILLGDAEIAVGAGAESMSRAPYISPAHRFGARMGDSVLLDMMTGALSDPFDRSHMGVTAENVAAKFGIDRAAQDALAVESHRRAAAAIDAGYFRDQIVP